MPRYNKNMTDSEIELQQRDLMTELRKGFVKYEPMRFENGRKAKPKPKGKKQKKERQAHPSNQAHHAGKAHHGSQGNTLPGNHGGMVSGGQGEHGIKLIGGGIDYLENVIAEPNLSLQARRSRLGLSADKGTAIKNYLVENGFVAEFSVDLGKDFGGRVKMLKLTTKGFQALGKTPPKQIQSRRGSFEHQWWQDNIAKNYRLKGYKAIIEYEFNGKPVDVGVEKDGELIAVEIELSPKNAVYNFSADILAGFKRVVIGCKNVSVRQEVKKQIKSFMDKKKNFEGKALIVRLNEFPFVKQIHKEIKGY